MPRAILPPVDLGPLPPPGPVEGIPRPAVFTVGPRASHGVPATYKKGCRCPHCRQAWRLYRRPIVQRKRRERKLEEARQLLREAGELS